MEVAALAFGARTGGQRAPSPRDGNCGSQRRCAPSEGKMPSLQGQRRFRPGSRTEGVPPSIGLPEQPCHLDALPQAAARALAPLQPGGWALLDAGAGALEDWPVGNRVMAWVRLLRAETAAALAAALDEGLSEFPGSGDLEVRRALRLWAGALLRAKAWNTDALASLDDQVGESGMASSIEVIGKKIGVTSPAVQGMLGIDQPDLGFLTDAMWGRHGVVDTASPIAPGAEAAVGFLLNGDLQGPGVTPSDVLAATESVMARFE